MWKELDMSVLGKIKSYTRIKESILKRRDEAEICAFIACNLSVTTANAADLKASGLTGFPTCESQLQFTTDGREEYWEFVAELSCLFFHLLIRWITEEASVIWVNFCGQLTITPTLYSQKDVDTPPNYWGQMFSVKGTVNATAYRTFR